MHLRFHALGFFESSRYRMNIPKLYHEELESYTSESLFPHFAR